MTANWLRYYKAAKNTIDIGTADAPLATMTLGETDEKYRDLVADLGRFSKEVASSVKSTAEARANETEIGQWILAIGGGVGVLISIIASVFISGSITKPIHAVTRAMEQLSSGDTTVMLGYSDRQDEIGTMVRAIGVFRQTQLNMRELELQNRRQTQQRMAERKAEMAQLADRFEAAIVNVVQAVSSSAGQLELAAATLKDTAEETKRSSADVVTASQNAYGNVEGLASAVDELSKSVHEISHQAAESTETVSRAVQQASFADSRMTELSSAASRIEHVVQLITAIAAQTNLLALNATIEASRAGAAGKGFAVVAAEVKNLAAQTAHATGEIGAQVAAMQIATGESVAAIKGVGSTIKRVAESASVIFSAVDRQRSAAEEISSTVRTAADCTRDAATRMSDVSQGAIETGSAATQVLEAARLLSEKGSHLRAEVDRFLANVRAA